MDQRATYDQTLHKLYELQKFGIKLGLNSTRNILARLGEPHMGLPCVHLAGTNGKGSVGAMLEAALGEAGIRVGFYTSPHLVSFNERYRVDGREITDGEVIELARRAWAATDDREPPTFFEIVTAMAFDHFKRQGVELAIMETGLGGRLDATNVCQPAVTVITNIGLEHQEYLGSKVEQIAWEKAGIIKQGVAVVHGVKGPKARPVVEARAAEMGAPVVRLGRDVNYRRAGDGRFSLRGRLWRLAGLTTNLAGRHQPSNAALALGAAECLAQAGWPLEAEHLRAGLTKVNWPGRLEQWPTSPGQPQVWLDGAHNVAAARALAATMPYVKGGRNVVMVCGIMADKDIGRLLAVLCPLASRIVFTRTAYERGAPPERLAAAAPPAPPWVIEPDLAKAIALGRRMAGSQGLVLITGSLFTVGEARALLASGA